MKDSVIILENAIIYVLVIEGTKREKMLCEHEGRDSSEPISQEMLPATRYWNRLS